MPQAILLTIIFTTQALLLCSGVEVAVSCIGAVLLFSLLHGIGAVFKYAISEQEDNHAYLPKSGAFLIWYGCLLLLALMLYKVIFSGVHVLYQAVLRGLENYYGISLGAVVIEEERLMAPLLLLVFLSALLLPAYQWGERHRTSWWFFVDLSIFAIALPLILGNAPRLALILLLLGALLFYRLMFFFPQWRKLSLQGQIIMGMSLLVLMGVALLFSGSLEPSIREKHSACMAFQKNLESRLGLDGWSDYNNGYLTNSKPVHTHQIMLSLVAKSLPQSKLYLRGYVGARYNGSNWGAVDNHSFYQKQQRYGESKLDASISNANYIYDRISRESYAGKRLVISYNRVHTPYVYAPYFSYFEKDDRLLEGNGDATLLRKTDTRMTLFYMEPDVIYESGVADFMGDQAYEDYVNAQYKEVPKHLEKKLLDFLGGKKNRELPLSKKVELITDKLQEQCDYRQELETLSLGEDYVEHFLWEEQAGYCTHFATTATLLFRCLDVPARYASGYQVNPEDFMSQGFDEYLAEVPDDMAHAWAEIYFPNVGWIPVETTPGYGDSVQQVMLMDMENREREEEEEVSKREPSEVQPNSHAEATTQASANTQETVMKEKEDTTLADGKVMAVVRRILVVLLLIFLLLIVMYYGRKIYFRHLYQLRHQKDNKQALYAVTKQLIRGLKRRGYQRGENEEELAFLKTVLPDLIFSSENETRHILKMDNESRAHQKVELTREELTKLIVLYYRSLSRAAYSLESVTKDDVFRANQLYDCIFK